MLGVEFDFDVSALRKMIIDKHIFTEMQNNKKLIKNSSIDNQKEAIDTLF
jgi:hypothetical protein